MTMGILSARNFWTSLGKVVFTIGTIGVCFSVIWLANEETTTGWQLLLVPPIGMWGVFVSSLPFFTLGFLLEIRKDVKDLQKNVQTTMHGSNGILAQITGLQARADQEIDPKKRRFCTKCQASLQQRDFNRGVCPKCGSNLSEQP
ncbi:MAG: hypothetical protein EDR02_15580 [Actinobacteria bacterium]|nr:MAG: hypothetical protein EDR02_15580 [Actinomycetota bacterium]RIK03187.1 MAG: hypothetical protein DCC48_16880 [Acidobacteriota bacterium]